jgi:2-polyprenyl-6-methoxyphenol hydroxylase-like FAD-dependent oxidoreductase
MTVGLASAFGAETEVECRYLVGCDGPRSGVRQAAGIEFPGQILDWIYTVAELTVDWELPEAQSFEFLGADHVLVAHPLPTPGRFRFSTWEYAPVVEGSSASLGPMDSTPTLGTFEEVVGRVVPCPVALSKPAFLGRYRVARKMAERFRSGRIFLAGDAAHVFPPVTGLGMNLGLHDAAALARILAEGSGSYDLLEGYHRDRFEAARRTVETAEVSILGLATAVLHGSRGAEAERELLIQRWGGRRAEAPPFGSSQADSALTT